MKKIRISGAGPVGLACAAWLLQKNPNLPIELYDRLSEDDRIFETADTRGIAISQGSKLLLESIGAWHPNAPAIHTIHVSHQGHFGRAIVRREELGQEALGYVVRYADIHLALRQALRSIARSASQFQWHFSHTGEIAPQQDQATVLIHAEGGLFKDQDERPIHRDYEQSAIVGWVKTNQINSHYAWERFTPEGPLALLPSHRGEQFLNLVWCAKPDSVQERLQISPESFIQALQNAFGTRAGEFLEVGDLRAYPLGLNAREEIVEGHQVWIGNAAQTLHPVAGQGLNLGLRDAHTLAEELLMPDSIANCLARYAAKRQQDRRVTIRSTDFLARIFTSKMKPVIWARGLALSALQLMPPIKSKITRQMMFGQR